ncbi:MAG: DUF1016 N-terminal domain-containing protein, partial [Candidatus Methanoperedens sp.]|nr:DUF1016 N-terminal domain-containing protein [Candidatus Methanoperedens sp.]
MVKDIIPNNYAVLLNEIKQRIRSAQYEALKAVNKELISLYWDIGQMIVDRQKEEPWGKSVVEQLAKDLQAEFSGIGGFSSRNIWRMRSFYLTYKDSQKLPPLVAEIGWTHNHIILEKCKDNLEREFYIRMTRKFGWSKNVLIHRIENQSYEKTPLNQTTHRKVRKERKAQPQCGTRMTRIGRIYTDTANPRLSAQSAFHHVCSSLKNAASGASVSEFIRVHPRFFY